MCGRYYFSADSGDERAAAILRILEKKHPGEYKTGEILPGDSAPAVLRREGKLIPVPAVFGIPGFQGKRLLLNARGETAAVKPAFAESLRERRIVLPASGFYEWGRDPEKTKYYFTVEPQPVIYLCGLYELREGVRRFVILTRAANGSMAETHDRMPVILSAEQVRPYLTDGAAALALIASASPPLRREAV